MEQSCCNEFENAGPAEYSISNCFNQSGNRKKNMNVKHTFCVMCLVSRIQTTASLSDDNNSSLYWGLSPVNHVYNNQLVITTE